MALLSALEAGQVHDQKKTERSPAQPIVEHRKCEIAHPFSRIGRSRDEQKQKSCQRQTERLVHAAAEDRRGNGREQKDDYGHSHWRRTTHTSRKAIADSGNIEGERSKRRMEIQVRNLSRPDAMRTIEKKTDR
ncbi:hypothetical protein [Rhizobium laguerreae]|uniref:Uncharacterized protein n=1 Tax=Rhizobium laguerreae TaxID=1076926 RepID=A0A7Y2W862_9HYPH|nr:hypothetical protein [Rhizobium laguerreae]NNH67160.1 hypothetical protein [Rhizobium laguerreae]